MKMYESIKDFGKKSLLLIGLIAITTSCTPSYEDSARNDRLGRRFYMDVNEDGVPDGVYLKNNNSKTKKRDGRKYTGRTYTSLDLMVAIGKGDGTFESSKTVANFSPNPDHYRFGVKDIDGDGHLDAFLSVSGSDDLIVAKGDGNGNFFL